MHLNLDWDMKFLPVKNRELRSEFFGKRGISWHFTVVIINDTNLVMESNKSDTHRDGLDNS